MLIYTLSDLIGLALLAIICFVLGVAHAVEVAASFWSKVTRRKP